MNSLLLQVLVYGRIFLDDNFGLKTCDLQPEFGVAVDCDSGFLSVFRGRFDSLFGDSADEFILCFLNSIFEILEDEKSSGRDDYLFADKACIFDSFSVVYFGCMRQTYSTR